MAFGGEAVGVPSGFCAWFGGSGFAFEEAEGVEGFGGGEG